MQIAAEHAEGQRIRTRQGVKERLLLGRIALQSRNVIDGHAQVSVFIEANFADAALAGLYQAAMPAGVAPQRLILQMLGKLRRAFGGHLVQNFSE